MSNNNNSHLFVLIIKRHVLLIQLPLTVKLLLGHLELYLHDMQLTELP